MMNSEFEKLGEIGYKMTKQMAQSILKTRKGDDFKMRPDEYIMKVVNEDFGLAQNCVKIIKY